MRFIFVEENGFGVDGCGIQLGNSGACFFSV